MRGQWMRGYLWVLPASAGLANNNPRCSEIVISVDNISASHHIPTMRQTWDLHKTLVHSLSDTRDAGMRIS